jgi:hypothetical protein
MNRAFAQRGRQLRLPRLRRGGDEVESFEIEVSATQATIAGFGHEGPSKEWVRERLVEVAAGRLVNDAPVLPQMRAWASPIILLADPS